MNEEEALRQRRAALARANERRCYRAKLKKRIKARQVTWEEVEQLIWEPHELIEQMPVSQFLFALPTFGVVKRDQALRRLRIGPKMTFGGLAPQQRGELASLVSKYRKYLLPSDDQPDHKEEPSGNYAAGVNHHRQERSPA